MRSHRCHFRLPSRRLALAGAACLLAVPPAFAQAFDAVRLYGAASGEDAGRVGAVLIAGPAYAGSDERRTMLVPLLDYQWNNGWFAGTANGIGINLSKRPDLQYGLRLTADFGRKASRSNALRGMGNVDASAELGAFFNQSLAAGIFLTSSLRYGAGDGGLVVDLGAGYATALAPSWRLAVGGAVSLANASYLQSFFGVNSAQSANSAYPEYRPGAGLRDARANVALTYLFNRRTSLTTALAVSALQADARNSPLVRQATTASGVMVLSHAF
jgi:outer membrane protein